MDSTSCTTKRTSTTRPSAVLRPTRVRERQLHCDIGELGEVDGDRGVLLRQLAGRTYANRLRAVQRHIDAVEHGQDEGRRLARASRRLCNQVLRAGTKSEPNVRAQLFGVLLEKQQRERLGLNGRWRDPVHGRDAAQQLRFAATNVSEHTGGVADRANQHVQRVERLDSFCRRFGMFDLHLTRRQRHHMSLRICIVKSAKGIAT